MQILAENFTLKEYDLPINKEVMNLSSLIRDDREVFLKTLDQCSSPGTSIAMNNAIAALELKPDKFRGRHIIALDELCEKDPANRIGGIVLEVCREEAAPFYANLAYKNLATIADSSATLSSTDLIGCINKAANDAEFWTHLETSSVDTRLPRM